MVAVCGPPGSGKSTYVRTRKSWGDLVIDVDALYSAMGAEGPHDNPAALKSFVLSCRDLLYDMLEDESDVGRAWVISCAPRRKDRNDLRYRLGAEVVVLEVPESECLNRIMADPARKAHTELWREWVHNWWERYEPGRDDIIRSGGE